MGFLDIIKNGMKNHFDKKKEEREMMEKMQREVDFQKQEIFRDEFKKNALEVARAKAKKEAAIQSGLQKLRSTNRARNLEEHKMVPGSFFGRLSEYTQKNIANREKNLGKTQLMRNTAKYMREENMRKRIEDRRVKGKIY